MIEKDKIRKIVDRHPPSRKGLSSLILALTLSLSPDDVSAQDIINSIELTQSQQRVAAFGALILLLGLSALGDRRKNDDND